jgi:hypothetical protein
MFGQPYELGAAPISRFLLAHAIKEEAIEFVPGELKRVNRQWTVKRDDRQFEDVSNSYVVVRHGPMHPLKGFLTKTEAKALRRAQRTAADFATAKHFNLEYFLLGDCGYPSLKRDPQGFAHTRLPIAREYVRERFHRQLMLRTPARAAPFFEAGAPTIAAEAYRVTEAAPLDLFGIHVSGFDAIPSEPDELV